jgi:hypothetical protein
MLDQTLVVAPGLEVSWSLDHRTPESFILYPESEEELRATILTAKQQLERVGMATMHRLVYWDRLDRAVEVRERLAGSVAHPAESLYLSVLLKKSFGLGLPELGYKEASCSFIPNEEKVGVDCPAGIRASAGRKAEDLANRIFAEKLPQWLAHLGRSLADETNDVVGLYFETEKPNDVIVHFSNVEGDLRDPIGFLRDLAARMGGWVSSELDQFPSGEVIAREDGSVKLFIATTSIRDPMYFVR